MAINSLVNFEDTQQPSRTDAYLREWLTATLAVGRPDWFKVRIDLQLDDNARRVGIGGVVGQLAVVLDAA